MKITHIIFRMKTGGAELMLIDIVNNQVKAGHEVSVIVINEGSDISLIEKFDKRTNLVCLNRREGSKNPLWLFRLNKVLWKLNPDVIHSHDQKALGMIYKLSGRLHVFTVHCTGEMIKESRNADLFCSISDGVKDDLLKRENIESEVIWNGLDCDRLSVGKKKDCNIFKIVCVSRLFHETKGQHLLLKAVANLKNKNIAVDFIGNGPSEDYLRSLAIELGVDHRVTFLGNKSRDYVYEHLCEYSLLVQPSLSEGFGLTIAEALAAKTPVLTSDLSGPMQVIDNGRYGTFFKANDVGDLTLKINYIIDNYNEIIQKTEDAYCYVRERFDVKSTADAYLDIYRKYINYKLK